jgi:hypothetical protein
MESVYHIVTIRVNETSLAHVWRLRSHYLGTGYHNESVIWTCEGGLALVVRMDQDLMITRVTIQLAEVVVS